MDCHWSFEPPKQGRLGRAIRIYDNTMTLEIDDRVVATARFSQHAAADGSGAWIISTHPARLFIRDQAVTALTRGRHRPIRSRWHRL